MVQPLEDAGETDHAPLALPDMALSASKWARSYRQIENGPAALA